MDFGGRYLFAAERGRVWAALNDAEMLKAAIPGCDSIAWTGAETLDLSIRVNLGIARPGFAGELRLSDVIAGQRYTLAGRARGGLLGGAAAVADITLVDDGAGTVLSFTARGEADSGIMRLGKTLIGRSAQGVIDRFFIRIGQEMAVAVTPIFEKVAV